MSSTGRFRITVSGKPRKNPDINGLVQVVILLGRQLAREEAERAHAQAEGHTPTAGEPPTGGPSDDASSGESPESNADG